MCPEKPPGLQLLIDDCLGLTQAWTLDSALLLYSEELYSLPGLHLPLERLAVQCREWDRLYSGLIGQVLDRA